MHTVDMLEEALRAAEQLGYRVRHEWLGGSGGGACEIRGVKCLFLDLGQSAAEQLAQVVEVLREENHSSIAPVGYELGGMLRRAA